MSAPNDAHHQGLLAARTKAFSILQKGLATACSSGEHSDCKLVCGSYQFDGHKVVFMAQSGYFQSAFKKDTFMEGDSGTIELMAIQSDSGASDDSDDIYDDPEIVKLIVQYFYHLDYTPTAAKSVTSATASTFVPSERPTHIIEHARVFAMAVKYQVDGLRALAAANFQKSAQAHWNHDDFTQAISIVHKTTPDEVPELRDIVTDIIHEHFDALKLDDEFETVVTSFPPLAYGLLTRVGTLSACANGHTGVMNSEACQHCRSRFDFCEACKSWIWCPYCGGRM